MKYDDNFLQYQDKINHVIGKLRTYYGLTSILVEFDNSVMGNLPPSYTFSGVQTQRKNDEVKGLVLIWAQNMFGVKCFVKLNLLNDIPLQIVWT